MEGSQLDRNFGSGVAGAGAEYSWGGGGKLGSVKVKASMGGEKGPGVQQQEKVMTQG